MNDKWPGVLGDSRRVEYSYEGMPDAGYVISAKIAGEAIIYAGDSSTPLTRLQVERDFADYLANNGRANLHWRS